LRDLTVRGTSVPSLFMLCNTSRITNGSILSCARTHTPTLHHTTQDHTYLPNLVPQI
jgi:hypothetical protein